MRHFLFISLLLSVCMASAQETTKFSFRVGHRITGSEEFTTHKTDSGYEIDGTTVTRQGDKQQQAKHHTVLNKDWTLVSYKSETTTPTGAVVFDVGTSTGQILMKATWPGGVKDRGFPLQPKTFVLENFVPSHMQAALRANTPEGTFNAIVPSAMDRFDAKVSRAGTGEGTLGGKTVKVTKYTVTGGGPTIEAWTDDASGDLMRVYVPGQDVEYLRDGFKLNATPAAAKEPPPSGVTEREVHFTSAGLDFPATLTLPANTSGKVPVIVFVHGSGALDRDETVGPNKPFRDLAWGLAQQGVGSLRYDKRAFLYPTQAGITLDTQVIADAAAALQFAATQKDVDPKRVFLLGHSLGGGLAPYIAERSSVKGIILMAAPARGMNEVIKDQIREIMTSQGKSDEEIAKAVAEQDSVGKKVLAGNATDADLHGVIPAPLFKDMLSRDPAGELQKVDVPLLVLEGGKDAQVFESDFDALRDIAAKRPGSEAKMFPNLDHLFMPVAGKPDVSDVFKPGHVAPEVIDTIATWVKKTQ
jgi:dienelactone hydrolase